MATPAQIASPSLRIRFIQAAKEGQLDVLKKYVEDGVPVNTTDSCGYSALHWASAHGQPEVINFLIFNGADLNLRAKDGMTPLHLAAAKHKLNAAHLLVEANADRNLVNEAQERPIDLCGNDPPMASLLRDGEVHERGIKDDASESPGDDYNEMVLTAAKDLLSSTLVPVTAYEETIVLACQKAADDANKVQKAKTDDYAEIQKALAEHRSVSDEFKSVVEQVEDYRNQLGLNRQNVSHMSETLAETQKEVTTKLQSKRTANVATRDHMGELRQRLENLNEEYGTVTDELTELEARVAQLRARKAELESDIHKTEETMDTLSKNDSKESKNETLIAVHQESLQATRTLIDNGDQTLNTLQDSTSQRLLKTGMDYANFLRKYMGFVNELTDQFNFKVKTMQERIEDESRNYEEVSKLHLKMDSTKLTALVAEYKANLSRFERRRDKILQIAAAIKKDFTSVQELVGEFGRELEPLE